MTTISASSTIGIDLISPSYTNPVVVEPGVALTGNFTGYAIYAVSGSWSITNAGTVAATYGGGNGSGIHLGDGGTVTNQHGGVIAAPLSTATGVYIVGGAGAVTNAGTINAGVWLQTGGTVTNQTGGRIISSSTSGYGVGLHAGGTVTNAGQISGLYFGIDAGVGGGTVTNQAGGRLNGQLFGVEMGFPGQVAGGGGNLTNEAGGTISGDSGFIAAGSAATVNNAGAIMGTFAGTASAHGYT